MNLPQHLELAGLSTTAVENAGRQKTLVVLLHGHSMRPSDLVPFASSLAVPATFLLPQGPVEAVPHGHSWWPVDMESKARALQNGPRDLFHHEPAGLADARKQLGDFLDAAVAKWAPQRLILGGFSQGAMLACDWLMHGGRRLDALILLSGSRLNFKNWEAHRPILPDLPVLISHGRQDSDLAFAAGEHLRDFLSFAGAKVTWVPFDGAHEIPLLVWRRIRRLLTDVTHARTTA